VGARHKSGGIVECTLSNKSERTCTYISCALVGRTPSSAGAPPVAHAALDQGVGADKKITTE
jgi:hypothetical protein